MHSTTRFAACSRLSTLFGAVAFFLIFTLSLSAQTPQSTPRPSSNDSESEETNLKQDDEASGQHSILVANQPNSPPVSTAPPTHTSAPIQKPLQPSVSSDFKIGQRSPADAGRSGGQLSPQTDNLRLQSNPAPASRPPALAPITNNQLRGSSPQPLVKQGQPLGKQPNTSGQSMQFRDSPAWDAQPIAPMPSLKSKTPPISLPAGPEKSQPSINPTAGNGFGQSRVQNPSLQELPRSRVSSIPSSMIQQEGRSNIQPTQYQQSPARSRPIAQRNQSTAKIDLSLARQIMERYQLENVPDPLPGRPLKLVEIIEKTPISQRRSMLIQYWETLYDWASVQNSKQYLDWLRKLPDPLDPNELAVLKTARAAARNQVLADEIQLGKSQSRLQQFMARGSDDLLPLPADDPLIQTYQTHYDWYQTRGRIPANLKGIDTILPKTVQLISHRASTVGASRVALNKVRTAYAANPRSLGSVLETARLWNEAEQALVSTIVSYNQAVGDYSLTIAQGNKPPKEIVAMLISKPKAKPASSVRRQTAGQTLPQTTPGRAASNQPSTLGGRTPNPAAALGNSPINRTMNARSDLSPKGYSRQPSSDSASALLNRATSNSPRSSQFPPVSPASNSKTQVPNQQPPTRMPAFEPPKAAPAKSQPPTTDRNAFNGNSFNAPRISSRNSDSANEFNSFPSRK